MSRSLSAINAYLQQQLRLRGQAETTAVEAARWLDRAGLLKDSPHRPGLPLRELLRSGGIQGQRQEPNGRWFIDRVGESGGSASPQLTDRPFGPSHDAGIQPVATALEWDTRSEAAFREQGFVGFVPLGMVVTDRTTFLHEWANQLQEPGVYAVFVSQGWEPSFATGTLENVINPWSEDRLLERWISEVDLIYIGCAGATTSSRTLRKRLSDLLKHGAGLVTRSGPHKGGERLWQCRGWESFTLAWKGTEPYPAPHDLEVNIGTRFAALASGLPFANVRL